MPTPSPVAIPADQLPAAVATIAAAQGGVGAPPPTSTAANVTAAVQPSVTSQSGSVTATSVTAVGDSVMLAATGYLEQDIPGLSIDAMVGRQVPAALDVLMARKQAGTLGSVVIVHVGNNGLFTTQQFDEMMHLLAGVQRVVVVNDKVPRDWQGVNNAVLAAGVKRYPNTVLVDWYDASASNPSLFWSDGVHLRPEGAKLYASLLAAQVNPH